MITLFHSFLDPVVITSSEGIIISANEAFSSCFDKKPEECNEISFFDLLPSEHAARQLAMLKEVLRTKTPLTFDYNRKGLHLRNTVYPFKSSESSNDRLLIVAQDITDIGKKLENDHLQLKQSEKRFRAFFEGHSAVILVFDPDTGSIIDANPAAVSFYGWPAETLRTMRIQQIDTSPADKITSNIEQVRASKQNEFLVQHRKADGSVRDVEVLSNTINIDGTDALYAIIHDITDRKQAAAENDRIKHSLLSNVSHELRSPIHGILGLSELLKDPDITRDEQLKYIGLICHGGQILLHLVNDLIDISRIEADKIKLQIAKTSVNQLLRDLHAFYEPKAIAKGLQFRCTAGLSDPDSFIETDGVRVTQILTNLIQNALKFTNSGSIDIGYVPKNSMLEFYCLDTGVGIPSAMKEKIFDRFQQVDNPSIRNNEGIGLGLNISRSLVELLGGTIGVESEEGKGSRFFFTLPCNPLDSIHAQPIKEPAKSSAATTILLAEDDKVSELLMRAILKKENMTILSAENGQIAVAMAANHPEINIVLMDINMPVMNGLEATKKIKQLRPDLPVIEQTAYTSSIERQKAQEAGCDGFITKPIRKGELVGLIKELLNR